MRAPRLGKVSLPIALVVALLAGVVVGRLIRGREPEPTGSGLTAADLETRLVVGEPFPDVALIDEWGDTTTTQSLVADQGKVVLFIEIGCPPCEDMCRRWQSMIEDGSVDSSSVLGIVTSGADGIPEYRQDHGLSFPMFVDPRGEFRKTYAVRTIPLEVLVGQSGRVRSTNRDPFAPNDPEQVQSALMD